MSIFSNNVEFFWDRYKRRLCRVLKEKGKENDIAYIESDEAFEEFSEYVKKKIDRNNLKKTMIDTFLQENTLIQEIKQGLKEEPKKNATGLSITWVYKRDLL